uniref:Phospholipid-transporting ATPase n=1 Tax=Electrophorus electricus TaxID=8005 RepID=A0A4W4F728_ELEEL
DREHNLSFKYAVSAIPRNGNQQPLDYLILLIKDILIENPHTNAIKTSKYNVLTFLPLNLFEQFQRIANAYFLCLLVLQVIPAISSLSWFTTVVPLALVLSITAVKDAIDDLVTLCLSSSHPLSPSLAVSFTLALCFCLSLCCPLGEVCCEPPNNRLDRFVGTLVWRGQKHPLDNHCVLLRGCTLRNTDWCFGLVLFAGPETKLMQNCGKSSFKRTSIDRLMNVLVLFIFGFLVFMCIILAVGHGIWEHYEGTKVMAFVPQQNEDTAFSSFLTFWSYIIILNTVVPISLYVSMEVIRLGNSYYINWDRLMFHTGSGTAAEARTTTLNEELGQIRYVFSDKTGTLTQNIMCFHKCSINGKDMMMVDFSFNSLADPRFQFYDNNLLEAVKLETLEVHSFFRLLAICHTVMAEEKNNDLVYQAQSPDEGALVTAARNFGFVFRLRTPESVCVVEMGVPRTYELLAILDFNNVRKRMSVIVRSPEGKLALYCKGADTIIYKRLHESCSKLMEVTTEHLNLIGATAIEDKLQDGVSQTIEQLAKADIKIWVLTGDKQETAENIGYSCNLLREEMDDIFIVAADSPEEVRQELRCVEWCEAYERDVQVTERWHGTEIKGLLILGIIFTQHVFPLCACMCFQAYALEGSMELEFLRTACMCKTVICCRVTPMQKAQVVELVKKYKQAVTLAIGDGANDVSMIKAAHIGVGISGQEGMQAVLSSDFSFAQFRYLQRLLLVHGRWSYLRMCKFLRYFFYKNFTFTFVHFWFAFFCGFSAQTVYDETFIALYNLMYTALPVLGMGLFDQDVSDGWSLEYPQLYEPGQRSLYFSKGAFIKCALHSCYSSLVLFFVPYAAVRDSVSTDGHDIADHQSFALLTQTCLTVTVCVQLGLDLSYWTAVNHLFVWGSLGMYFLVTFTMQSDGLHRLYASSFPFVGTARNSLDQVTVWLTVLLTAVLCVLPVVVHRFLFMQLNPTINDKVLKVHQMKAQPPPPRRRARIRRSSTRRSGYAFSHAYGYGDLVTSKRFLRRPVPSRSAGSTPAGRSAAFRPAGRSAGYSPSGQEQNPKQATEPTELQRYRAVHDATFCRQGVAPE